MRPLFLLSLLIVASAGCTSHDDVPPPGTLPPGTFARVYADLLGAGIPDGSAPPDTAMRKRTTDSLLALRKVTREEFDSSVVWYNADVHRWRAVMDSTTRILESELPASR